MRLSELAKPTEHKLLGQDVEVGELQYNSRKVKAGDVFCCIVGTFADGHAYAAQAVEQGAAALVVERELPLAVPQVLVPNTRIAMAEMAAGYYGYPRQGYDHHRHHGYQRQDQHHLHAQGHCGADGEKGGAYRHHPEHDRGLHHRYGAHHPGKRWICSGSSGR